MVPLKREKDRKKYLKKYWTKHSRLHGNYKPTDPRNSTNTRNEEKTSKKLVFYTWGKYPS